MMTKKDYEKFAKVIKVERESWLGIKVEGDMVVTSLAQGIATVLREDNPRFDAERFLEACGIPEDEWNL